MLLNTIYSNIEKRKKLNQYIAKINLNKSLSDELFINGCYVHKNGIPTELIKGITQRYCISKNNFIPANRNLSLPILDNNFLEFICSANFNSLISQYYETLYSSIPKLQVFPAIVITNPLINQSQYRSDDKSIHIPASFHIDYPTEFTIHIPLMEINENTPHTVYVKKSCTNIYFNELLTKIQNTNLKNRLIQISGSKESPIFASPGDLIMLDVTGLHRAEIKPNFRAFIQLKYTIGNDGLKNLENSKKFKKSVQYTALKYLSFQQYKVELQKDIKGLIGLKLNNQYSIIKESLGAYQVFLGQDKV